MTSNGRAFTKFSIPGNFFFLLFEQKPHVIYKSTNR